MTDLLSSLALMSPPGGGKGGSPIGMFVTMGLLLAIFYVMLIRPQQRKEKDRRKLMENIKSGERIMFSGGIIGTVTNVKEHTLVVKIAEKVKIEIARGAVSRVIEKGDEALMEEK